MGSFSQDLSRKWSRLQLRATTQLHLPFLKGPPNTHHRLRRTQRTSTIIGSNLLLRQVHCQVGNVMYAKILQLWCPGYTKAQTARQNHARRSQTKNCWFYLVSWTKNLKENWRKLARLSQTTPDSVSFCNQSKILTLSGTIWPTSFKFPANFWSRKPDRTSNFFVWLRLAWFCLAVWAWCSQSITLGSNQVKYPSKISGFPTGRSGVSKLLFLSQEILYLKAIWRHCLNFTAV